CRPPLRSTLFPYTTLFRSQLCVAIFKVAVQLTERRDFCGANESKILRPEKIDFPLILEIGFGDRLKSLSFFQAHCGLNGIRRELDRKSTRLNSSHDQSSYA